MVRAEHACPGVARDPAGIPRQRHLCFQSEASALAFPGRTQPRVGRALMVHQGVPEGSFHPGPNKWDKVCHRSSGPAAVPGGGTCAQ